jgi:putative flavoprotein involved in K+ transport
MFQFTSDRLSLPGCPYDGDDPEGFAHHTEVLERIERYGRLIEAPVRENTTVERAARHLDGWELTTSRGPVRADHVVSATGPFQRPHVPEPAASLAPDVFQVHASSYRNPQQLPPGAVLVVGAGASGLQIAEELLDAGRPTYLSVSRHRRMPRRYRGHDLFWWLERWGFMERTRDQWPDGRMPPSLVVTGVGGGHDVDVRRLRADGAVVLGHLTGVDGHRVTLAEDAEELLAAADAVHDDFVARAEAEVSLGLELPPDDRETAPRTPVPAIAELDLERAGVTSVVWCTGYRLDLGWVDAPVLDAEGEPVQVRGVTPVPGFYFLGLHWMHTFGSGLISGVSNDAAVLTEHITGHR